MLNGIKAVGTVWAIALMLIGCAGGDRPESVAASPLSNEDARRLILTERAKIWKDPESIRDASIGNPYRCSGGLAHVGAMPNACVCVEANAKNGFGGYTGLKRTEILISGSQIVDMLPPREPTYSCGPLTPFPELNGNYSPQTPAREPRSQAAKSKS